MKKNYMFLFLLLMSGFIYAQSQTSSGTFSFANETQHFTNQTKSSKAVLDSIHYDNLNGNTLGYDPGVYGFYAYYPHDSLILLNASATHLVSMKVFIGQLDFVNSFTMKIFTDTTASTLIHSQVFFPVVGWNEILLSAPIAIPATSGLFVGFEVNTSEMTHPVG